MTTQNWHEEIIRTKDVRVRIMVLSANEIVDWHSHSSVTDNIFCLTGRIQVEIRGDSKVRTLLPGDRSEIRPGIVHRVSNIDPGTSTYLLVQGIGPYDMIRETR